MNKNRDFFVVIAGLVLILIAVIGATYAFFSVTASVTEQSLYVHTSSPTGLIYDGVGLLSLDNAIPGDRTSVKTFTIENPDTSSVNQVYKLSLHVDSNNFSAENFDNQLLMYIGYGNCEVDETSGEPLSCDSIVTVDLTDSIENMASGTEIDLYQALIEPDETQEFFVYIRFIDVGSNQDENKNKSFGGHIVLKDTKLVKDDDLPYANLSLNNKVRILVRTKSEQTLDALNLQSKSGTPDFSFIANTDETSDGLYSMRDDYGVSYYFRGNVTNNYVIFGKNSNNQDMYWRILRINGDGSLRIVYDGTQAWGNMESSDDRIAKSDIPWNLNKNDVKFVGYMYGGADIDNSSTYSQPDMNASNYANSNNALYNETDSNIKRELDSWYEENILNTNYSSFLSDEIFCNDRSVASTQPYSDNSVFGSFERLFINHSPSLICPQKNDAFTVGASDNVGNDDATGKGNGYLKYPVGLISADELVLAGAADDYNSYNNQFYLFRGYHLNKIMSPRMIIYPNSSAGYVTNSGYVTVFYVDSPGCIVPVINLSAITAQSLIGDGTIGNEYRLS